MVPANSDADVHFQLTVPRGTPPGEYAGGIIIQSPPVEGETSSSSGGTQVKLNVIQRQGVRIYLTVAGTPVNSLTYGKLNWKQTGNDVVFTLPLRNTGNTIEHPSGSLDLKSAIGSEIHLELDRIESLLPGATVELHGRQANAPLFQAGIAHALVTAEAGVEHAQVNVFYAPWVLLLASLVGPG